MKCILVPLVFVCSICQSQKVQLNGEQRFYIETGLVTSVVNFTRMNGGGKDSPYVMWNTQIRTGVPINFLYRNRSFQFGISSTLFAFGTGVSGPSYDQFFLPNDIKLHLGYNLMSLTKNKTSYIGPFSEIGFLNMGWSSGLFRGSCLLGIETYIKNRTKVSLGVGIFNSKNKPTENQQHVKPYPDNNFFVFEISHSFPIKNP